MMEAIILAGGFGTRLSSVVSDVPKPMAPINGRPFLEFIISDLVKKGFKKLILSVGYKSEIIINHFGDNYQGIEIVYQIEDTPLGTGGAIKSSIQHCRNQFVYIINGDTYVDVDINMIENQWLRNHSPIVVTKFISDTSRYGAIITQGDKIISFNEKSKSGPGLINAGWYLMPKKMIDDLNFEMPFSFETDFLSKVIQNFQIDTYITDGKFIDIGTPDDYDNAQGMLKTLNE